jgi:hypothetical protein
MRRTAILVGLLLSAFALTGASGSAAPAKKHCVVAVPVPGECEVKPDALATGATSGVTDIRWEKWGDRHPSGFGTLTVDDTIASEPAQVRLGRPRPCGERLRYSRATITYGRDYTLSYVTGLKLPKC